MSWRGTPPLGAGAMGGVWKAFLAPAEARSHGELATALNRLAAHVDAVAEFEEALRLDARYLDERPASGQTYEPSRNGKRWP